MLRLVSRRGNHSMRTKAAHFAAPFAAFFADAKGAHSSWELREGKKHQPLFCHSGPVDDRAQAEHSAGVAVKAFKQATVTVK